ncbi:hypothetical protein [Streptomyces rimosus]|uniref:hypothetical protein n=1 Tax=Streptomyces TaxID=1883 RepID=UPI001F216CA2|nr:hypothetical protein [Streptomyces rimosus]
MDEIARVRVGVPALQGVQRDAPGTGVRALAGLGEPAAERTVDHAAGDGRGHRR